MMQIYTVQSATPKGHRKQLVLSDGTKGRVYVQVPRFACVGKGDQVTISSEHPDNIYCLSSEIADDLIRISPHFESHAEAAVGNQKFPLRLTEVNREADVEALQFLEQFHYKSVVRDEDSDSEDLVSSGKLKATSGGRRAIILLYAKLASGWVPAGYIELQMPLMMCKPRHDLFAGPFIHSKRSVHWAAWDAHAIKRNVNLIVRIARVVTHPDFRGLGLARHLIQAAKTYAKDRWQLSGRRPLFMEISAQMLNYIDFVSTSGFFYVGQTEGNASRVVKDLGFMRRGYEINTGIMSLQKKYLNHLEAYCKETKTSVEDALLRLAEVLRFEDPAEHLTPTEWAGFRKLIRPKIPYFLAGLDEDSETYLRSRLQTKKAPLKKPSYSVRGAKIDLNGLTVRARTPLPKTRNVRLIMDAFGLEGDEIESTLIPPTNLKASSGNIIFVVGASGSGKSALLRALDPSQPVAPNLAVHTGGQRDYSCGWLTRLPPDGPIFDYFATKYGPENAFAALSKVGLSEAFVLIKPYKILSRGQQYRCMMADLLLREEQVWLLDEFCADLDPLTARIVAHNLRKMVIGSGRIAVVAAANHGHYLDALRPTQVIEMRTGAQNRYLSFRDYRNELLQQVV